MYNSFVKLEREKIAIKKEKIRRRINNLKEYTSESFYYENKKIITDIENNIKFKMDMNEFAYISFQEKNLNFNKACRKSLMRINKKNINIFIKAKIEGKVEAKIIQFKDNEKVGIKNIKLNKENKIDMTNVDNFRIVFRVKEIGVMKVENIIIDNSIIFGERERIENKKNDYIIKFNNNILVNNNIIEYKNSKEHQYLELKNCNKLKFDKEYIKVEFKGISEGIDAELHILGYDDGMKRIQEKIKLNENKFININKVLEYKLLLRIKGIGKLTLDEINIDNKMFIINEEIKAEIRELTEIKNEKYNAKEIYFLDYEKIKELKKLYYNDTEKIIISKLDSKEFEYISIFKKYINIEKKIYLKACLYNSKSENLKIKGILKITNKDNSYKYIDISENNNIKLDKNVKNIEGLARISNKGIIKDINIELEEYAYEPIRIVEINLQKEKFFNNNNKEIILKNEKGLKVESFLNEKFKYISYLESNNSFNLTPEHNIIEIKEERKYTIHPKVSIEEDVNLAIMIIFYSEKNKLLVKQLMNNSINKIVAPKGAKKIRIALRIQGKGEAKINKIEIKEFENIVFNQKVLLDNAYEVSLLKTGKAKAIQNFKAAVIMDEFTTSSYEDEIELIKLTPNGWKEELIQNSPDFLFIESAWKGNSGVWFKKVGDYGYENNRELFEIIDYCNKNNIPTVFWNKEDPVHFERFINTAKRFDLILTTDQNSVLKYREYVGENKVYALPFAAQPKKNNPIKIVEERINKACFAGSYYNLHEERAIDTELLLDEVLDVGVDIYDRNYEMVKRGAMPNHIFPERFNDYILGSLKYYEIDKAYKGYKLMINLNTVKYSPTMFARRVFEGLACGTPIISNYSEGVEKLFGDIVYILKEKGELKQKISRLMTDENYYGKMSLIGMREVFEKHTYKHRLKFILEKLNLNYCDKGKKVSMICNVSSEEEFKLCVEIFNKQIYKNKDLLITLNKFEGYIDIYKEYNNKNIKTYINSYMQNYSNLTEFTKSEYVAFININDYYGENYLRDLMNATLYTNSEIIGKKCCYNIQNGQIKIENKEDEFKYVNECDIRSAIIKPEIFKFDNLIDVLNNINNIKLTKYTERGIKIFSSDRYNYLKNVTTNKEFTEIVDL